MRMKEEEFKKGNITIWKEKIWKKAKKRNRYQPFDDDDESDEEIDGIVV